MPFFDSSKVRLRVQRGVFPSMTSLRDSAHNNNAVWWASFSALLHHLIYLNQDCYLPCFASGKIFMLSFRDYMQFVEMGDLQIAGNLPSL